MVLVDEVMGGVRHDPSSFPDGLFFIYGCEQGAICEKTRGGDNFERHFIQEK